MMNHKRNFCLVAMVAAVVVGCREESSPLPEDGGDGSVAELTEDESLVLDASVRGTYKRDLCMVEDIAMNIPFSEGNKSLRFVSGAFPLVTDAGGGLKSVEQSGCGGFSDTLAYVVNFADSMGCAIIPADTRVPEDVLFYSESGNLGDTVDNPGFGFFMEMAADYVEMSVADAQSREDSVRASLLAKLGVGSLEDVSEWNVGNRALRRKSVSGDVVQQVRPLSVVEWGQYHNRFTKERGCNGNAPSTGCGPTALAQIMAYYRHPQEIGGYKVNWDDLLLYTDSQVERKSCYKNANWVYDKSSHEYSCELVKGQLNRLMERICTQTINDGDYQCDGTSAKSENLENFLRQFYTAPDMQDYRSDAIISSLDKGNLVYGEGVSHKNLKRKNRFKSYYVYEGGHAWYYDGYIRIATPVLTKSRNGSYLSSKEYFHINWGWDGCCNGYFASNVFDAFRRWSMNQTRSLRRPQCGVAPPLSQRT